MLDDAALVEALTVTVPNAFGAGAQDVLLTGLALALAGGTEHGGATDGTEDQLSVLIDVEGHGRAHLGPHLQDGDLTRTLGWFTSMHPVRFDIGRAVAQQPSGTGETTVTLLKQVKERLRALPQQGLGYGLVRHLNPVTTPALAALPAPEVSFNYLGRLVIVDEDGPDWLVRSDSETLVAQGSEVPLVHALETVVAHEMRTGGDRLSFTLTWPEGVLDGALAQAVANRWIEALRALAEYVTGTRARGLTPSDLLLDLAQAEIDQFEAEF
ncbi:condensation domain-containing protein [Streptomyces sp. NPDC007172]|uniref:condensation domain-containing protein n=1 Tax=Streptomyces sp. NPDC007172 TaxID=3364776 RepID=UPI0036B62C47